MAVASSGLVAIGALLAMSSATTASAWEMPLTIENPARSGLPPFVSGGVPLLVGQAKETTDLRLAIKDDEKIRKYQQGRWGRNGWDLPNPGHTTLDLLYDRYLLMGDVRALENMAVVAGHGAFYAIAASPKVNRDTGWSWRAFDRYWNLTGEKRAGGLYKELIQANLPLIGKPPLVCQGQPPDGRDGLTHIWCHAVTMATLHTGDLQLLELLKTAAEGKEKLGDYYYDLFAVLYHLTGEEKYKELVMRKTGEGQRLLRAAAGEHVYFPPAAHWLLNQQPVDRERPAVCAGDGWRGLLRSAAIAGSILDDSQTATGCRDCSHGNRTLCGAGLLYGKADGNQTRERGEDRVRRQSGD